VLIKYRMSSSNSVVMGNDEVIFVLTKADVYQAFMRIYGDMPMSDQVWQTFKANKHRLNERLDHADAIEDILIGYCLVPPMPALAPPTFVLAPAPQPAPAPAPQPPVAVDPVPATQTEIPWDKRQRKRFDTEKFTPPGYGRHVVWPAHRARAFMIALNQKPSNYDTNIRILAKIAGVHPYDFRWKTNPVSFGRKNGLSEVDMREMMGKGVDEMRERFNQNAH